MKPIIQSLWIGHPLSLLEQLSITSFLRHGHEFHLYCYEKMKGVPAGAILRDAAEILPASQIFCYLHGDGKGSVAAFANLFRYKLLLERGGWWCDLDMVCIRPFDFEEEMIFASERNEDRTQITNAVIKLPVGHDVARICYETAAREQHEKLTWGKTGPRLLSRVVREKQLSHLVKIPEIFCPVDYDEWQTLLATDAHLPRQRITEHTRTIHFWHEAWRRARIKMKLGGGEARWKRELQKLLKPFGAKPKVIISPQSFFAELLRQNGLRE